MKIGKLAEAIELLLEADVPGLLVGESGCGKTSIIHQVGEKTGRPVKSIYIGQMADAGDLTGLPEFVRNKDGQAIKTIFIKSGLFPDKPNTILFFDEINRGPKDLLQCVFQCILDKEIAGNLLPPGCRIMAACNPPNEDYVTQDFDDKAWTSRFCKLKVESDFDAFLAFCESNDAHPSMLHFLHVNNEYIKKAGADFTISDKIHWNERTWEKFVSPILKAFEESRSKDNYILKELLTGVIGIETTTALINFMESKTGFLKAEDILKGKFEDKTVQEMKKYMLHKTMSDLYLTVTRNKLTGKQQDHVVRFLENVNQDTGYGFLVRMDTDKHLRSDSPAFEKNQLWNNDRLLKLLRKYNVNSKAIRKLKEKEEAKNG